MRFFFNNGYTAPVETQEFVTSIRPSEGSPPRLARRPNKPGQSCYSSFLQPLCRFLLTWTFALLALSFMALTVAYASKDNFFSKMPFVYSSSSNTIFVLVLLTHITGSFLSGTIASTLDLILWLLVSRDGGIRFSNFLALAPGTGIAGLLLLARGWPVGASARSWGIFRLIAITLPSILGVLIMSNVNTRMTPESLKVQSTQGWGMSPFNATLAQNVSIIADQLVQAQLAMFLFDSSRALDITPTNFRNVPCAHGPTSQQGPLCTRTYFMPGGVEFAAPIVNINDTSLSTLSEVYLAEDQRSYVLEFQEGTAQVDFEGGDQCQVYGFPFAAFNLCLQNTNQNSLQARIVQCPDDIVAAEQCQTNDSWHSNIGWTTTLTTSFRRAMVSYSKVNGSITTYDFVSQPLVPAPVNAPDLLQGYRYAFGNFSEMSDLQQLLLPTSTPLFPLYAYPAFVAANLRSVDNLGAEDPALVTRGADILHCLLAIMLYFCQPNLFARVVLRNQSSAASDSEALQALANYLNTAAPADTNVTLARIRYQIIVARDTLISYAVLCGLPLLLCLAVLLFVSFSRLGKKMPKTSSFPFLDAAARCSVENMYWYRGRFRIEDLEGSNTDLLKSISHMKVELNQEA